MFHCSHFKEYRSNSQRLILLFKDSFIFLCSFYLFFLNSGYFPDLKFSSF
ncbi:hypothetical protein HOLDEFILI_00121 [Holdemania filiformis DSM 12042]|uniref:Uncharacterized protein n=1 Tax=Holdemania filiformis DSM 12042 TaxID=545696 RepID=B9Y2U6_9FIRM|nr:hypothetical protein HOLDEFILI_00121 [Holdemania filiformis DSM 12042]